MIPVQSTMLEAIEYDQQEKTLIVEFKRKTETAKVSIWKYWPVLQADYDAIMAEGASIGREFYKRVLSNKKIEREDISPITA